MHYTIDNGPRRYFSAPRVTLARHFSSVDLLRLFARSPRDLIPAGVRLMGETKGPPRPRRKRSRTELARKFAYLPRANTTNPSRFGMVTVGNDCAFMVSLSGMTPLRLSKYATTP